MVRVHLLGDHAGCRWPSGGHGHLGPCAAWAKDEGCGKKHGLIWVKYGLKVGLLWVNDGENHC